MIRTPAVPVLVDPKLIDVALSEIQTILTTELSWLDHAFGKAQRLKRDDGAKTVTYPAVYIGVKDYLPAFPDSHIGNFAFFDIQDGEEITNGRQTVDFEANFGLIVWFDYRSVYSADWQERSIDNVKAEVIEVLKNAVLSQSSISLVRSWERSESIYKGYTDNEVDRQFLMRPYGGFKIEGIIKYHDQTRC